MCSAKRDNQLDENWFKFFQVFWKTVEKMKGGFDSWEFKEYILGFIFYKYISEDFARYVKEEAKADDDFDYSTVDDNSEWIEIVREELIEQKGYFIYPGELFQNLYKRINDEFIIEDIEKVFESIERSSRESSSKQSFEELFGRIKLKDIKVGSTESHRKSKIRNIIEVVRAMCLNLEEVFEQLIENYALSAEKDGKDYFTPVELSDLLAALCIQESENKNIRKVYDPACGFGSSLLKFLDKVDNPEKLKFYGQEIDISLHGLCRMNMFIHGINYSQFVIQLGDTLTKDKFLNNDDKRDPILFDVIVSHIPFSITWEGKDDPELLEDPRFLRAGTLAPKKWASIAFIQHSIYHLNDSGIAAIVCCPKLLFRDQEEKEIRKWMVIQDYLDGIIQLPHKLFGVGSNKSCIMIFKKNRKEKDILFVDASRFFKRNKNRGQLEQKDINEILKLYREKEDKPDLVRKVSKPEIEDNDFKLSVDTYLRKKNKKEEINIQEQNETVKKVNDQLNCLREEISKLIKEIDESLIETTDENTQ